MTHGEIEAFNAGVRAVLQAASKSADAIEAMSSFKITRAGFAVVALRELAEAGVELLLGEPARAQEPSKHPATI
jgi:hypothetical protein